MTLFSAVWQVESELVLLVCAAAVLELLLVVTLGFQHRWPGLFGRPAWLPVEVRARMQARTHTHTHTHTHTKNSCSKQQ